MMKPVASHSVTLRPSGSDFLLRLRPKRSLTAAQLVQIIQDCEEEDAKLASVNETLYRLGRKVLRLQRNTLRSRWPRTEQAARMYGPSNVR